MKKLQYLRVEKVGDCLVAMDVDGIAAPDGTVRPHMMELAFDNGQAISFDSDTGTCRRVDMRLFNDQFPTKKEVEAS